MKLVEIKPLPDWLDKELWDDFIQYRIEIGKKLSPTGEKRALMKLERLIRDGGDQTLIMENTITSKGWAGIFMAKKDISVNLNSDAEIEKFCADNGISTLGRSKWDLRDRIKAKLQEK